MFTVGIIEGVSIDSITVVLISSYDFMEVSRAQIDAQLA